MSVRQWNPLHPANQYKYLCNQYRCRQTTRNEPWQTTRNEPSHYNLHFAFCSWFLTTSITLILQQWMCPNSKTKFPSKTQVWKGQNLNVTATGEFDRCISDHQYVWLRIIYRLRLWPIFIDWSKSPIPTFAVRTSYHSDYILSKRI